MVTPVLRKTIPSTLFLFTLAGLCLYYPLVTAQTGEVRFGLLLPDRSDQAVIDAARLAVTEANRNGGFGGQPFDLAIRTAEGPWGAGSKESVNLVFEDSVCAILGSLDGRNGHLAEQVATKAHITYLETRTTEPTLSQAFVPWFFRCVPSDDQQASLLLELIGPPGQTVAVLSDASYDTRYFIRSLEKAWDAAGRAKPRVVPMPGREGFGRVAERIAEERIGHLVVPFHTGAVVDLVNHLLEKHPRLRVCGAHAFSSGLTPDDTDRFRSTALVLLSAGWHLTPAGSIFAQDFKTAFGYAATTAAAHTYDGVRLLINSTLRAGTGREAIRDHLAEITYRGVTGTISFDAMGNRTGPVHVLRSGREESATQQLELNQLELR